MIIPSIAPDLRAATGGDVAMKFFPATAATVYERPPMRKADVARDDRARLPSTEGAGATPEIIWSEATGEFIDLATQVPPVKRAVVQPKPLAPAALTGRILVVDDDAGVREILTHILRQAGYQVRCAEDGETGWDAFRSEGCDLLITDQAMPGLTGIGLLQRVREDGSEVPAILISGNVTSHEGELARWLTPGVTLAKPFSGAELLTAVRGILMQDVAAAS